MISILLCICLLMFFPMPVEAMSFSGNSYVILDCSSNQVIESQNMYDVQSVASISKIMTAIIAIENQSLDTRIIVDDIVNQAWGSGIYVQIGDTVTLQDLLYGLLLRSGNDAALLIAQSVSGDIDSFVALMNEKALELGLSHTTFSNPSGLDEEDAGNLSCAYDMAIIMDYCCQNDIFREIIKTEDYQRLDGNGTWKNKNRLLTSYEYCIGGKTGFTDLAKRTLVSVARKDDLELIIVTLNCGNDFEFHESKYIEYYDKYEEKVLIGKGIKDINNYRYIIDLDIKEYVLEEDEISLEVENNVLYIIKNKEIIDTYQLTPYSLKESILFCFHQLFSN